MVQIIKKYCNLLFFLFLLTSNYSVIAQEIITPLHFNPLLLQQQNSHTALVKEKSSPLYLPFYDDFSYYSRTLFPDQSLWEDSFVFINGNFPKNPPTLGVATFDAINQYGKMYPYSSSTSFEADYLTSKPIRLDSSSNAQVLDPNSNVWLSFYYQPQGYGNNPNTDDSLVLELKSGKIPVYIPVDTIFQPGDTLHENDSIVYDTLYYTKWKRVWSSKGMTYDEFKSLYATDFKIVNIHLTDTAYFKKDFQFRFKSYASVANTYQPGWSSNVDHWNIDYVYLNFGRSESDTTIEDIAFRQYTPLILNKYRQIPWLHFKNNTSAQNSNVIYPFFNLSAPGSQPKNISLSYTLTDYSTTTPQVIFTHNGGSNNHPPQTEMNYNLNLPTLTSSTINDSAIFELKAIVATSPDFNNNNNNAVTYQRFYNFYAIDDATPEFGYGINVKNGKVAIKYSTLKPDTLRAVQIYFNRTNQTDEVIDRKYFYLTVWKSLSPEIKLYEKGGKVPEYNDSLNKFITYNIDSVIVLTDSFYIGWRQYNTEYLNVGFDANTNSREITKFNIFGNWENSLYEGTIMLHPVFGAVLPPNPDQLSKEKGFKLYPNPAKGTIYLESFNYEEKSLNQCIVSISDYTGREVFKENYTETIDISNLNQGLYMLNIYNTYSGKNQSFKFIISE